MSSGIEHVLVVPSELRCDDFFDFTGFVKTNEDRTKELLDIVDDHYWFHRRDKAEEDVSLLQIIPYVVITRPSKSGLEYYAYQRTSGGGDSRLHGQMSIGLGGHVNTCDVADLVNETLINNIRRELDEEVDIFDGQGNDVDAYSIKTNRFKIVGEIYSDDSPVSRVHYGIVYQLDLNDPNAQVALRETHKMRDLGWYQLHELDEIKFGTEGFESWSRLFIDSFEKEQDHASAV